MSTDWSRYNLPALQAMIAPENECTGADRVLAWEGLATSVRDQRDRLLKAQEQLAAIWPPERNASAQIFQAQISHLAASMDQTLTYAEDTRAGLRGVLEALATAQVTIGTLATGRKSVSTDLVPHFIDHAEDEYDERAQQAMRVAEAAIDDHRTQIRTPPPYTLHASLETITDLSSGGDDGNGGGSSASGSGSRPGALRATPHPVPVPHDPVLGAPPPSGSGPSSPGSSSPGPVQGVGPGLAGVTITPPAAAPAVPPAVASTPPVGGAGPIGGAGALGLFPGAGATGGFGAPIGRGGAGLAAGREAVSIRRGLPSGTVIGATDPAPGRGAAGRSGVDGDGAGRGGVNGGGAGRGGVGRTPMSGKAGSRRQSEEDTIDGEADQQWAALDGVAPVIAPDHTPVRHDPGPGVLGFGR